MNLLPSPPSWWSSTFILLLVILQDATTKHYCTATTFTFVNRCNYTLWPSILAYTGTPKINTTGFELPRESSRSYQFPTGWSGNGMFWARTGCKVDQSGSWWCQTGDCGTGLIDCNGSEPSKPFTLGEFFLGSNNGGDFYDVSLVDGFNVPMNFEAMGGSGTCGSAGCHVDLNRICPAELALKDGEGCMDPCEALGNSEYCCVDAYDTPDLCKPNDYTEIFKDACPRAYSYAFDDSETFTCEGADFVVTFCPSSSSSSSSS